MSRPLDGIRVLEGAQWWFVPAAGFARPMQSGAIP